MAISGRLADCKCAFEAIFNFGDSNSDTGGFWAAFPAQPGPYGMTYFKKPAGRATDGRLMIDFLGLMTIRAFGEEERFFIKNLDLIDINASPFFHCFAANEWLIEQLGVLSAVVLSSSALCMVLLPPGTFSSGHGCFEVLLLFLIFLALIFFAAKVSADDDASIAAHEHTRSSTTVEQVRLDDHSDSSLKIELDQLNTQICAIDGFEYFNLTELRFESFYGVSASNGRLADCKCAFEAIFNFGDSNSDTGGFWAAFPAQSGPYGMTYFKKPAGRATDGRLMIDFLDYNFDPKVYCGNTKVINGSTLTTTTCSDPYNYVRWDGIHALRLQTSLSHMVFSMALTLILHFLFISFVISNL
ncbi:hypothetical protein TEA_019521 [Camellia sinensis var. sinensis]|uniref:Uncharacterized protein n=1 Tax=Camellia sinensis var. sinensis TaxID=542762 RepID=A0A4S4F3T6_CAMSN|nr:hypothetical protein TEA_019521 [Camellia sinensis var. sinensis]